MFLLLGQPVTGLPLRGCGGRHGLLAGSQLAPLQPEEGCPPTVDYAPVSVSLYVNLT